MSTKQYSCSHAWLPQRQGAEAAHQSGCPIKTQQNQSAEVVHPDLKCPLLRERRTHNA